MGWGEFILLSVGALQLSFFTLVHLGAQTHIVPLYANICCAPIANRTTPLVVSNKAPLNNNNNNCKQSCSMVSRKLLTISKKTLSFLSQRSQASGSAYEISLCCHCENMLVQPCLQVVPLLAEEVNE